MRIFDDGNEVPGFLVYGLAPRRRFPTEARLQLPRGLDQAESYLLTGEEWEVLIRGASINTWPSPEDWAVVIDRCLGGMLSLGATVAWIGCEGLPFVDPPNLFDEEFMVGGVLAWASVDGSRSGELPLAGALGPVSRDELGRLRQASAGLAEKIE
ncbi:hypothetical protein ACFCVO_03430 [Agromyces sp. NPDC056379]|uniref:hypothetical protein n=1 Tax=unclassified Agromyces TaxID=2639701 RepID=UPI0035DF5073